MFNTCPHQSLQAMTGKPLDVIFKPDITLSVIHTLIPVLHHWEKVKEDHDQDITLGITEPVPVDTPATWCSRIVVTHKKKKKKKKTAHRCMVDLQKLNTAIMRETHYTLSPFNQVSSLDQENSSGCMEQVP